MATESSDELQLVYVRPIFKLCWVELCAYSSHTFSLLMIATSIPMHEIPDPKDQKKMLDECCFLVMTYFFK